MEGISLVETDTLNALINEVKDLRKTVYYVIENPPKQYLSPNDVMTITGFSRDWVFDHQQHIGYSTIGGSVRFKRKDLESYIEANYIKIKKR